MSWGAMQFTEGICAPCLVWDWICCRVSSQPSAMPPALSCAPRPHLALITLLSSRPIPCPQPLGMASLSVHPAPSLLVLGVPCPTHPLDSALGPSSLGLWLQSPCFHSYPDNGSGPEKLPGPPRCSQFPPHGYKLRGFDSFSGENECINWIQDL